MINLRTALLVCVVSALAAGPILAAPVDKNPDHNGNGWGRAASLPWGRQDP